MKAVLLTMSIGCGNAMRNEEMGNALIEARSPTSQDQNLHPQPSGGASVLCGAFTAGRSGSVIAVIPSTRFVKGYVGRAVVSFRSKCPSRGFQMSGSGRQS